MVDFFTRDEKDGGLPGGGYRQDELAKVDKGLHDYVDKGSMFGIKVTVPQSNTISSHISVSILHQNAF